MSSLTIYKDNYSECTAICNRFIDEYMVDANDVEIKVYLYLIRMMSANRETGISDMADKFNHTEKDILRSLKYWEKKKLLSLEYDSQRLIGIRLTDPANCRPVAETVPSPIVPIRLTNDPSAYVSRSETVPGSLRIDPQILQSSLRIDRDMNPVSMRAEVPASVRIETPSIPVQRTYTRDELKSFKENPETNQLLFVAETYLNKQLNSSDVETLYFIRSELNFTCELIDFLLQYCIEKGKKSFAYIKKVAIDWAENDITTPKQAKSYVRNNYDKSVYTVMKLLGRSSMPTAKEAELITKWTGEFGFSMEVIEEACNRTVLATDSHRLEYCDKILSSWKQKGLYGLNDIAAADSAYRKPKAQPAARNSFNQFQQNSYDFADLERRLLNS
ncbi:MAG: DnaD domain protein [Lachnospiraceae bacterium]|nr:DnaD domain protein [Lachnospiraceae bacterium]